jgi:hypothetical protein
MPQPDLAAAKMKNYLTAHSAKYRQIAMLREKAVAEIEVENVVILYQAQQSGAFSKLPPRRAEVIVIEDDVVRVPELVVPIHQYVASVTEPPQSSGENPRLAGDVDRRVKNPHQCGTPPAILRPSPVDITRTARPVTRPTESDSVCATAEPAERQPHSVPPRFAR